ncbi:MAG: glycosyl hydrolase family 18 protein [Caldilineaceae bacterium]
MYGVNRLSCVKLARAKLITALCLLLMTLGVTLRIAAAHGSMEDPTSRVYQCFLEGPENPQSEACKAAVAAGGTQQFYDWTGINQLADDDHQAFVPNGHLCSGGKESHQGLDLARDDWRTTNIVPDVNGNYDFVFRSTAPHSTKYFDFYVTKDGYDPTQPLRWSDLETAAFCHITEVTLDNGRYTMTCPLPAGKSGKHVIYNIWQRDDSAEAFYTCIDVEFGTGDATPTSTPTGTPATATPTPPVTPTPDAGNVCQVDYQLTSAWSNGFNASVTITNLGHNALDGWTLTWSFPGNQTITSLWNGQVNQSGSGVIVTNASWNGVLAAHGGAATIGFAASFTGVNEAPATFLLNGMTCTTAGGATTPTVTPSVTPTVTITTTVNPPTGTPTPTPSATTLPSAHGQTVVAYFTQWGVYARNYHVKDIVTSGAAETITVINYAFGNIVNGECIMTTQSGVMDAYADYQKSYSATESVDGQADAWNQPLRGNFNQLRKLKQQYPQIKVLISLGGWTWSAGFHEAAKTAAARQKVVASCLDLYIRGNLPVMDNAGGQGVAAGLFDGIDIDWEYPADPGNGNPYGPEDSHNFTLLLQEFRAQLDAIEPKLMLTIATGAGVDKYSLLELDQIYPLLDHINIMSYDFHGAWESVTGFNAPLYTSPAAPYSHPASTYAVDSSVQGYLETGVPAAKIIMGIPFYGRGWRGVATANQGLWQNAAGGATGAWEAGIEDYKVLKTLDYPVYRDETAGAVWKFNGDTFWSYDDPQTIAQKLTYVNAQKLGGVMLWSLDGDTADGELIKVVRQGLTTAPDPTETPDTFLYLPFVLDATLAQ